MEWIRKLCQETSFFCQYRELKKVTEQIILGSQQNDRKLEIDS